MSGWECSGLPILLGLIGILAPFVLLSDTPYFGKKNKERKK